MTRAVLIGLTTLVALTTDAWASRHHHRGGMPWCGLYARTLVARDPGPEFNRALSWLRWGYASGPQPGAMVIWSRGGGRGHVGKIVGGPDASGRWPVLSGNTGRDRGVHVAMRSIVGARFRVAGDSYVMRASYAYPSRYRLRHHRRY